MKRDLSQTPSTPALHAPLTPASSAVVSTLSPTAFRRRLMDWYRLHARPLPWRATSDPYRIWVSEIMLQQTRVAAVLEHYHEFLRRFPSLLALALAPEPDVLAAWSGLGYYRRARMLHKAAHFIMIEREGRLPTTSTELRTLPGIGQYTAAAIASIAFGESIAVVDGNVERVLLRLTGRPHDATAAGSAFIHAQAQALVPARYLKAAAPSPPRPRSTWSAAERQALAAAAHPAGLAGAGAPHLAAEMQDSAHHAPEKADSAIPESPHLASDAWDATPDHEPTHITNAAGDHNQAMMELGATLCLPRAPLCLHCPVFSLCLTRGEHLTPPRPTQRSRPIAYLLDLRKRGTATEVLLERRPADASLMPGMYELPLLPLDAVDTREPILRLRHAITNTNYYVQVFAPHQPPHAGPPARTRSEAQTLRRAIPAAPTDLCWTRTSQLPTLPLTGLARKVLQRLKVMESPRLAQID